MPVFLCHQYIMCDFRLLFKLTDIILLTMRVVCLDIPMHIPRRKGTMDETSIATFTKRINSGWNWSATVFLHLFLLSQPLLWVKNTKSSSTHISSTYPIFTVHILMSDNDPIQPRFRKPILFMSIKIFTEKVSLSLSLSLTHARARARAHTHTHTHNYLVYYIYF